ncbi:MAG: hypothetical protein NVSMB16_05760 [Acidimicrobiales bacterium]
MSNGQQPAVSTDGGRLVRFSQGTVYVRETGSGEPLLLLNGLGAHTGMWKALEDNLPGFHIVEFDLPGAGQSPTPGRPIGIPQLATLAVEVMDRYGLQRPDVLGYSMGGMVAQQLASKYPERVRRLVVAASTPGVGAIQVNLFAMLNVVTPARYLSPRIYSRTIGSMVGGRARSDPEWVSKQAAIRLEHRPSWKGYLSQIRSMAGWSSLPRLPKVTAPTLVIAGGDDPLAPPTNAMMIAYLIPEARLLILEDEGHLMMVDEQGAGHAAVREFLTTPDYATSDVWRRAAVVKASDVRGALARAPRQLPPLSLFDSRARRRWLHLDHVTHGA